jgi:polysaccharide deacetylase family protein (PEP-CTERM system associated)
MCQSPSRSFQLAALDGGRSSNDTFLVPDREWSAPGCLDLNALTCDVEDYFQVSAFEHLVPRDSWSNRECRIPRNIDRVLQLYADAGAKGTFFTLGWVARYYPEVVRRIVESGHEVASHGMCHIRVWTQSPDEFRRDILEAKKRLEDAGGAAVRGYRAASWSLDHRTPWAHQVIAEAGYEYSSSVYPVAHDHYGVPSAPLAPFFVKGSGILEVPASVTRILGRNWPAGGGGFFRLLPYSLSLWLLKQARHLPDRPAIFYFHPWELDPDQPRMQGITTKTRFRHYVNLGGVEKRLARLLSDLQWGRMDQIYLGAE